MQLNLPSKKPSDSALKILFVSVLIMGILFRFINLDKKVYWHDEVYTSLWLSGHSPQEVIDSAFMGQIISVDDLQAFQTVNSDSRVVDTVKLLAKHDPQHSPLYYIIARFCAGFLGDSVVSIRTVAAVISLLSLPLSYWLGIELFREKTAAYTLTGLTAILPFHILYAQEARQYSLLIATTLFASAALLRGLRRPTRFNWGIYTLSLVVSLYTSALAIFLVFAQGIYVFVMQRFRLTKALLMYVVAVSIGCLAFVPWLIVLFKNSSRAISAVSWVKASMPLPRLIYSWIENAGHVLFIFQLDDVSFPLTISVVLALITFIFIVYCGYFLYRFYPKKIWSYVFIVGGVTAAFMILPDLVTGGMRSSINRYLIPSWISIQLMIASYVAFVIKSIISSTGSSNSWPSQVRKAVFVFMMLAILATDIIVLQTNDAWIKQINKDLPEIAQIINSSPQPLVISGDFRINFGQILSLSHSLDSTVRLLLVQEPVIPEIPAEFETIWLYDPSSTLKDYIQKAGLQNQLVHQRSDLWQLLRTRSELTYRIVDSLFGSIS